jgi:hypothetical protein
MKHEVRKLAAGVLVVAGLGLALAGLATLGLAALVAAVALMVSAG